MKIVFQFVKQNDTNAFLLNQLENKWNVKPRQIPKHLDKCWQPTTIPLPISVGIRNERCFLIRGMSLYFLFEIKLYPYVCNFSPSSIYRKPKLLYIYLTIALLSLKENHNILKKSSTFILTFKWIYRLYS
jgi:hypothetical protein